MLRHGLSSIARRSVLRSSSSSSSTKIKPFSAIQTLPFHSTRQNEEAAAVPAEKVQSSEVVKSSGGLLGSGLSNWFALPIGMALAVPAIKFEWLIINEEFQLAAVFVAFCVTFYTQAGDAIHKSLEEKGDAILKEQNEVEDKVIEALGKQLTLLKSQGNIVEDFEAINAIREESYEKLNEAGKIKPLHDFKGQMEKMLSMIAQEESSVSEKLKAELLQNATLEVHKQFASSKQLKKTALESAIASIKGDTKVKDPVQDAFAAYFQKAAKAITAEDAKKEEQEQLASLVGKMNSIAKNEGFMFELDATGAPKMIA